MSRLFVGHGRLLRMVGIAVLAMGTGCPSAEECPDGSPRETVPAVAEGCTDIFECGPQVDLAFATRAADFAPIEPGSQQDVFFGQQGGYHFFVGAEMHNLCPVVFLNFSIDIVAEDGTRETIQELERHVQTVRCAGQADLFAGGCDGEETQQRWFPLQLALPCDFYPDDPVMRELNCEEPATNHIEDLDVILRVEVRDHSGRPPGGDDDDSAPDPDAREAAAEIPIEPVCCST